MSLARKVAYNTIIQIVGKVLTTLTSLLLVGGLARYLGVAGFGQYATIFAYTAFFAVFADFGFFNILVRELSSEKEEESKVVNNIITFRAILALVVYLVGFLIAFFLNYSNDVKLGIGLISVAQFWLTINLTLVGLFQVKFRMDKAAISDVIGRVITLFVVLLFIRLNASLLLILNAYIIGNMINFLVSIWLAAPYVKLRPALDWQYCRKVILQAIPLGFLSVISYIYFHVDMIILSLMKSSFDVGIYGAAYKILDILILFPAIFVGVIFPIFTKYYVQKDHRLDLISQQSFNFLLITGTPITVGVFVLAPKIIGLVAGGNFTSSSANGLNLFGYAATSSLILQILIFALFFSFFSHLFHTMIIAASKQNSLLVPNLIAMVLNIILNIILIPRYSYLAAAIITTLGEMMVLVFAFYITIKAKITLPTLGTLPKVLLSAVLMVLSIQLFTSVLPALALVVIAALVYFASLYLLGGIPKDILREIVAVKREA